MATREPREPKETQEKQELQKIARSLSFEKTWTLLFGHTWNDVHPVATIATVSDFWGCFNNVGTPARSPTKCDFYLFHSGIQPTWEFPDNKDGGKWNVNLGVLRSDKVDDAWLAIILGLVGEQYMGGHSSDFINGISLHLRPRGLRCSIWTRGVPCSAETSKTLKIQQQQKIGDSLRSVGSIPTEMDMEFKWHG